MTAGELRAKMANVPDDALVATMTHGGNFHAVVGAEYESASDDGEGHTTSLGSTFWLDLEEM